MRLFLAIDLSPEVRAELVRAQELLAPKLGKASFTKSENLHITMKFLGELRDPDVEPLIESLRAVRASSAIRLSVSELGCFPDRGSVRIIAAMFSGDVKALAGVHAAIEQRCEYLGFARERRKYVPHATIARARPILPPSARDVVVDASRSVLSDSTFQVAEFVLMQSVLKPSGAVYSVTTRFSMLG